MDVMTRAIVVGSLLSGLAGGPLSDVVTDWNETAIAAGLKGGIMPPAQSRNVALVQLAIFDALNAITPRYTPYRVQPPVEPGTSGEAAAAAAAHYLLLRLYPDQAKDLDSTFRASLRRVPEGPPRERGIRLGEQVAAAIFDHRRADGADAPNTYRPAAAAGTYVPTVFPLGAT